MSCSDNLKSTTGLRKSKHFIRSRYYDVMIKVDTDIYYLNKLQLACKSVYFEKLFIKYSDEKKCNLIELPVMDTDTFSAIVDIIYGQELSSVLNCHNYVTLLMAADYLQMEVNLRIYVSFIEKTTVLDVKMFGLYHFVRGNPNFKDLLPYITKYLSVHLVDFRNHEEFLSLSLDDIIIIVLSEIHSSLTSNIWQFSQICSEWIYHDFKSRLPHIVKLVNAGKQRFLYSDRIKEDNFSINLLSQQIRPEMIVKLFYKLLTGNGEINAVEPGLFKNEEKRVMISIDEKMEQKKLAEFLGKNHFYDIAVKVEDKTYKLHRFKLDLVSDYFAEVFLSEQFEADVHCAETSTQELDKSKEHLLHDVDQTTFEMIIEYIYFDEMELTSENFAPVFKAAGTLKIKKLFHECVSWMKENVAEVCSEAITKQETGYTLPICVVPFDVLEELLLSFEMSFYILRNALKIVDICSKWVMHDVKNRYYLIPQISFAINHNRMVDYDNYKMKGAIDLNNSSEQQIRDELWKTLCSTSLVPSVIKLSKNDSRQFYETPVFIALSWEGKMHVLDANLNEIVSFCCLENPTSRIIKSFHASATLYGDNLFILFSQNYSLTFYVYNLSLKKIVSLNSCLEVTETFYPSRSFSLLNCRGQIYCCFKEGRVFKYSIELNRWMIFSEHVSNREDVLFTSDGKKFYRLYESSEARYSGTKYLVELFDFNKNVWLPLSDLYELGTSSGYPVDLTITSDGKLAVIFLSHFVSFERGRLDWRQLFPAGHESTPWYHPLNSALTHCEGNFLYSSNDKLYCWSQGDETWALIKQLPSRSDLSGAVEKRNLYFSFTAIHRPIYWPIESQ